MSTEPKDPATTHEEARPHLTLERGKTVPKPTARRSQRAPVDDDDWDFDPFGDNDATLGPRSWASGGLAAEQVARFFSATADYRRSTPWKELRDDLHLRARVPGGGTWSIHMLAFEERVGLVLYAAAADYLEQFLEIEPPFDEEDVIDSLVYVRFVRRDRLSPSIQQEIRAAGWDTAGHFAYPSLRTVRTPGGTVSPRQMEDLIQIIRTVLRFVHHVKNPPEDFDYFDDPEPPFVWPDPESGVQLEVRELLDDLDAHRPIERESDQSQAAES